MVDCTVMHTFAKGVENSQPNRSSAAVSDPLLANLLAAPRPLTTVELARMVGMTPAFIREEIQGGYLHAVNVGRGQTHVYRIPAREAYRYIKQLGIL